MTSNTKHPGLSRVHCWHWHGLVCVAMLLLAACGGSTANASPTPTITPITIFDATQTPGPAGGAPSPTPASGSSTGSSTGAGPTPTTPAGTSSGWSQLESKPLHLPSVAAGASCPVTPGQAVAGAGASVAYGAGPAYVTVGETNSVLRYDPAPSLDNGSPWGLAQIHWTVAPAYSGLLLVRGRQLDGTHAIGFNGGAGFTASNPTGTEPVQNELRLMAAPQVSNQWYIAVSYVRVQAPGCYAYQFDGTSFSEVVVFQAASQ